MIGGLVVREAARSWVSDPACTLLLEVGSGRDSRGWNLYYPMHLDLDYARSSWDDYEFDIDEVEEGPIFAMCIAGAHDQVTLAKWIQGLQETNPALAQIPVIFRWQVHW
uniref:ECSIT C-terminal domain-containing protein n=1 Tax=Sciurus vulgaris TaxID=55149 RepID=A0A8D2DY16_SCIVU